MLTFYVVSDYRRARYSLDSDVLSIKNLVYIASSSGMRKVAPHRKKPSYHFSAIFFGQIVMNLSFKCVISISLGKNVFS